MQKRDDKMAINLLLEMNYGLYGEEGKAMSVMRNGQNDCGNEWRTGGNSEKRGNATNRTEQSPPTAVAGKEERFSPAPPSGPASSFGRQIPPLQQQHIVCCFWPLLPPFCARGRGERA